MIKISFCTNVKGRLYNLEQTFPENLRNNPGKHIEFVLLDYSSDDGMEAWVKHNFAQQIATGKVSYYASRGQKFYHMAHAKNLAHRLARGEIVCNLDADNFTGHKFGDYLIELLKVHDMAVSPYPDGTHGRIACSREIFNRLGGYNEQFMGYGWDDNDLKERASRMGLKIVMLKRDYCLSIAEDEDRTNNYFGSLKDIKTTNNENKLASYQNCRAGKLVANTEINWGGGIVRRNFNREYLEL